MYIILHKMMAIVTSILLLLPFITANAVDFPLELCPYLAGECREECAFKFVHKWGIPLCAAEGYHCCAPDYLVKQMEQSKSTTPAPTTTTTAVPTTTLPSTTTVKIEDIVVTSTQAPKLPNTEYQNPTEPTEQHFYDSELPQGDQPQLEEEPFYDMPNTINPGSDCGKPFFNQRVKRIIGGSVSKRGAWPWQVAFRYMNGAYLCGGALINDHWVVSAAHCFKSDFSTASHWRVIVGVHDLSAEDIHRRDIRIKRIIKHPYYRKDTGSSTIDNKTLPAHHHYRHDIALVELASPVDFNSAYTQPICLPSQGTPHFPSPDVNNDIGKRLEEEREAEEELLDDLPEVSEYLWRFKRETNTDDNVDNHISLYDVERFGECYVTGWGETKGVGLQKLKQVHGRVSSAEECSKHWKREIDEDMLCFGDGTEGPCRGDSGSPMSCKYKNRYYLVGVVSWGSDECNRKGYPSVFTRMTSYLNWMKEVIFEG